MRRTRCLLSTPRGLTPRARRRLDRSLRSTGSSWRSGRHPQRASAGASSPRLDIPFEKPGDGDTLSWSANPLGQGFRLRGKQYKKDRKKFPSEKPLYDVVHVLAFRSDKQKLDFGELIFGGDVGEIIHGCPTVYIANLMLPDYPPANPLWGKKEKGGPDGPGQHIVVVARMTEETRAELERCGGMLTRWRRRLV